MKRVVILGLSLMFCVTAFAAEALTPEVTLKKIEMVKSSERRDELYLAVTEFPSTGLPSHTQIPKFPMFWPSTHLNKVSDFKVWAKALKPGDSSTLILALIERDAPPWNTDDLVGEVKLQLKNDNGRLIISWSVPNRDSKSDVKPVLHDQQETFDLKDHHGHYRVTFSVQ